MQQIYFNLTLAFRAIRTNKLRSALTIAIIAIGITALTGILTSIDAMNASLHTFSNALGGNTLTISSEVIKKRHRGGDNEYIDTRDIDYDEAREFKERFTFPSTVAISLAGGTATTIQYRSEKTNPNIRLLGVDGSYTYVTDTRVTNGRDISAQEIQNGAYVCLLGNGVANKLFKNKPANAVNQIISVGNVKCRVVGVLEAKGGSMMMNADNRVFLPLNTARGLFGTGNSYTITVRVASLRAKQIASEEAEGLFRTIRKVPLGMQDNFSITQNNEFVANVLKSIGYISIAAVIIGIITLLGSVIGLMNIMLVSVAERTREIGVSKALGARSSTIKQQFLTESILISVLGGAFGVIAGMLIGNLVGMILKVGFIIPWLWIGSGVTLCAIVGIISGIYPAIKASRLDPIVALRYE
jgi:putative ABC transport system permease protein